MNTAYSMSIPDYPTPCGALVLKVPRCACLLAGDGEPMPSFTASALIQVAALQRTDGDLSGLPQLVGLPAHGKMVF